MDLDELLVLLALIYAAAMLGREIAERLRMPGLVGEILAGVVLGHAVLGVIPEDFEVLEALSELGVIFLLFAVGVDTEVRELRRVGGTAIAVAVVGVALPFVLGGGFILVTEGNGGEITNRALFLGAAMVATSVGITAKVLQDRGKLTTRESRIILGAAVVDDILTLILLAILSAVAVGQLRAGDLVTLILLALLFVAVVGGLGPAAARRLFPQVGRLKMGEPALMLAIAVALGLAALAGVVRLAPLVGAFLAGVILGEGAAAEHELEEKTMPLSAFFVPFFFVHVGSLMELEPLGSSEGLMLVGVVTGLAIIGKLVGCGAASLHLGGRSAAIIGTGMVPRGEVGIIVAQIGLSFGVIGARLYGVVVIMSLLTSILAPPALFALYRWQDRPAPGEPEEAPVVTASDDDSGSPG